MEAVTIIAWCFMTAKAQASRAVKSQLAAGREREGIAMAKMTPELARTLFDYETDTGLLRWKICPNRKHKAGDIAGTKTKLGYVRVMYRQQSYMAHSLAWAIVHGEWPIELDHRDRARGNNRLDNLRLVSDRRLNSYNRGLQTSNTSGFKGVSYARKKRKWWARINVDGKRRSLGLFDTPEQAAEIYRAAEAVHHGEWGIY